MAHGCLKHVENTNTLTCKMMCQFGYLQGLEDLFVYCLVVWIYVNN
jgi:hypothetical protein